MPSSATGGERHEAPAGPGRLRRLRKRAEFVRAASGRRVSTPRFVLQARAVGSPEGRSPAPGFGFTVTRKTGGAVERNRIRRRLKEAVRRLGPVAARPGHDYVLIGRRAALDCPFDAILTDLERALRAVHRGPNRGGPSKERRALSDHADD